ncbi:MAG: hypothetical protein AABW79_04825 [Nanoarchaeota archaeon]
MEENQFKYLVREVFIAKPGYAGELAKMMKEEMEKMPDFNGHVLLDFVTDYNKVVIEYKIKSMEEFEKSMTEHKKEQEKNKSDKPPKYTELYKFGKREIFKIL